MDERIIDPKLKAAKFTFKIENPTGRYRSFDQAHCDIKLCKKQCGTIHELEGFNNFKIMLMVKSGESFKWITLKFKPKSFNEAKQWLQDRKNSILEQFDLYFQED